MVVSGGGGGGGSAALLVAGRIDTVVLDKTGTLTGDTQGMEGVVL